MISSIALSLLGKILKMSEDDKVRRLISLTKKPEFISSGIILQIDAVIIFKEQELILTMFIAWLGLLLLHELMSHKHKIDFVIVFLIFNPK